MYSRSFSVIGILFSFFFSSLAFAEESPLLQIHAVQENGVYQGEYLENISFTITPPTGFSHVRITFPDFMSLQAVPMGCSIVSSRSVECRAEESTPPLDIFGTINIADPLQKTAAILVRTTTKTGEVLTHREKTVWNFESINRGDMYTIGGESYGSPVYYESKRGVYVVNRSSTPEMIRVQLAGDKEQFEYLGGGYARDDIYSYYDGKILDANGTTIEYIGDGYAKATNAVYYNGTAVVEADSSTFQFLPSDAHHGYYDGPQYTKDKNFGYFSGNRIEGSDGATFEVLFGPYARDKNFGYYHGKKVKNSDGMTFSVLKENISYAKDKNMVYYEGKKIRGSDSATFTINYNREYHYGSSFSVLDKNAVYVKEKRYPVGEGFTPLDGGYAKDAKSVYYFFDDYYSSAQIKEIPGASPETFEVLASGYYAKDEAFGYFKGEKIKGSDGKSFEYVKREYAKDKNNVYKEGKILSGADARTFREGASYNYEAVDKKTIYFYDKKSKISDGESFVSLDYGYAKDKDFGYYSPSYNVVQKIKGSDGQTFEVLGAGYAKDKNGVYYQGTKIVGADIETFEAVGNSESGYWKDKNSFYRGGVELKHIDVDSFEMMDFGYAKDKNHIFYGMEILEGSNITTFEVLGEQYAKDSSMVYYRGEKVDGADARSFSLLDGGSYGRDKNFVYHQGRIIPGSHGPSLVFVGNGYYKDKNTVYFYGEKIQWGEVSSFEYLGGRYFGDKENIYYGNYESIAVQKIDRASFVYLGDAYGKDANAVYYDGKKIEEADPTSFEYVGDRYGKDNTHIFRGGYIWSEGDVSSFQSLGLGYFKNGNHIYYAGGGLLSSADPETFHILPEGSPFDAEDENFYYQNGSQILKKK